MKTFVGDRFKILKFKKKLCNVFLSLFLFNKTGNYNCYFYNQPHSSERGMRLFYTLSRIVYLIYIIYSLCSGPSRREINWCSLRAWWWRIQFLLKIILDLIIFYFSFRFKQCSQSSTFWYFYKLLTVSFIFSLNQLHALLLYI